MILLWLVTFGHGERDKEVNQLEWLSSKRMVWRGAYRVCSLGFLTERSLLVTNSYHTLSVCLVYFLCNSTQYSDFYSFTFGTDVEDPGRCLLQQNIEDWVVYRGMVFIYLSVLDPRAWPPHFAQLLELEVGRQAGACGRETELQQLAHSWEENTNSLMRALPWVSEPPKGPTTSLHWHTEDRDLTNVCVGTNHVQHRA